MRWLSFGVVLKICCREHGGTEKSVFEYDIELLEIANGVDVRECSVPERLELA